MQNNRFVVLTGHLSNYPLSDLVGILRHQRKSGRLLIEYPKGPATFFFQNGELIDARFNELQGLQAICVALAQPEASFNFNPLIQSPRRSIESSLQHAVSELFGCWEESALQIETETAPPAIEAAATAAGAASSRTLPGRRSELLALPPGPSAPFPRRSILLAAAAAVIVIGLSTAIAVTGGFGVDQAASATPLEPAHVSEAPVVLPSEVTKAPGLAAAVKPKAAPERREEKHSKAEDKQAPVTGVETPKTTKESEPIRVAMQIENGRVLKASIANPRPGRESYEALALRIARQRRYPATVTGGETVTISVRPE